MARNKPKKKQNKKKQKESVTKFGADIWGGGKKRRPMDLRVDLSSNPNPICGPKARI
jgi:hypothetical protein